MTLILGGGLCRVVVKGKEKSKRENLVELLGLRSDKKTR